MIYLTAMRINSLREGIGINIFIHLKEGTPDPLAPWGVMEDPGPLVPAVSQREVREGGNSVEAYLDLLLNEPAYETQIFKQILASAAEEIEKGQPNPAKMEFPTPSGEVIRVAFSVNLGLADLTSRRRVFQQLRAAIERWHDRHASAIEAAVHRRKAAGLTSCSGACAGEGVAVEVGRCVTDPPGAESRRALARSTRFGFGERGGGVGGESGASGGPSHVRQLSTKARRRQPPTQAVVGQVLTPAPGEADLEPIPAIGPGPGVTFAQTF